MNKEEFEKLVTEFAYLIKDTYERANPEGKHLEILMWKDVISIRNDFYRDDINYPINISIQCNQGKHSRKELNDKKG